MIRRSPVLRGEYARGEGAFAVTISSSFKARSRVTVTRDSQRGRIAIGGRRALYYISFIGRAPFDFIFTWKKNWSLDQSEPCASKRT